MNHAMALKLAGKWVEAFAAHCERIEIAGSVRRLKPEVKDIEIVAIPKVTSVTDLFGESLGEISALEDCIQGYRDAFEIMKNGPKYKKLMLPEGIAVDLFIVTPPAQWGVQFMIRTGPAEFSRWMVTKRMLGGALPNHCYVDKGSVWDGKNGQQICMPEEQDYFRFCGLAWREPRLRAANWRRA
jgi:DNA polymerase/3'-5' exonuclease PolX